MTSELKTKASNVPSERASSKVLADTVELSVIIVNYNVKEFLEQALISVKRALQGLTAEIIVIDNNSHDGSVPLIRQRFPDVKLIVNKENFGFARACNQGLRQARGQFLAILNPDTIVQEDTFKLMLEFFASHPEAGMVGCKILNPDGSLQLACRRSYPTPWVAFTKMSGLSTLFPKSKIFGRYNLTYLDPEQSYEVEAISGSFMMIRRAILDQVGYLDEAFFLYGEDLDWCYRIREKGWKVYYFPGTKIVHFKGESSKKSQFDNLRIFYQAMGLFVKKHFRNKYFLFSYWLLHLAIWLRAGISFLRRFLLALSIPITDVLFINLGILLGIYFRFGHWHHVPSFIPVAIIYTAVWMLALTLLGCHDKHKFRASAAAAAILWGFLFNASFTYFFKQYAFSRAVVLFAGFLNLMMVPGWRLVIKILPRLGLVPFHSNLRQLFLKRKTLIVGDFKSGEKILEKFNSKVESNYEIAGLVSINPVDVGRDFHGIQVLGTVEELNKIIETERIQEVIFSTHKISYDRILNIIARWGSQRVNFKLVPSNLEVIIGKASIDRLDDMPLLEIDYKLQQNRHRFIKRAFDLTLALLTIFVTFPVYLFKRWISPGKKRARIIRGFNGAPVTLWEFASASSGLWDRLPYLWAILKGKLSFVGSEIIEFDKKNANLIKDEIQIKPGLTGLVQINRHKKLTREDKQRYYLYYMKNYSPLLDLEIIFKTMIKL
ncbi:MAG: glycosyltransferase [Calditrichaeota bacterium]|nr:MAG: glycosyltransferase [Calditrichota bacterium]